MQQTKTNTCLILSIFVLLLLSCNNTPSTSEESNKKNEVQSTSSATSTPAYDPELDPLKVAGANGKLFQDSLGIKIFEVSVKPGESAALHSHPDHAMYILEGGKIVVYSKDFPGAEKGLEMELKTGTAWVMGPVTDSARNIGNTTIKMLEIDVHRPRNK